MPSEDHVLRKLVRQVLDPERVTDHDLVIDWLIKFAWAQIDRTRLEEAVRVRLRRSLPAVLTSIRRELEAEGIDCDVPKPKPKPKSKHKPKPAQSSDDELKVLAALALAEAETPGALHSFRRLRPLAKLEPGRFDRAALALARRGAFVIHQHDYPAGLTPEERGWYVNDGTHWFVGAGILTSARS